jgi:hypothetical protein
MEHIHVASRYTWEEYFQVAAREMDPKALLDIALRCPSWEIQNKAKELLTAINQPIIRSIAA